MGRKEMVNIADYAERLIDYTETTYQFAQRL